MNAKSNECAKHFTTEAVVDRAGRIVLPNRIANRYRWVWRLAGGHRFLSVLTILGHLPIGSDHFSAWFVPVCVVKTDRKAETWPQSGPNFLDNSNK
jgi:hypothetical protein